MSLYYYIWFMLQNHATLKQLRTDLLRELRKKYPERESASLVSLIMEHSGFPSSVYLRHPEKVPDSHTIAQINEIVRDIHTGRPIQYILGYTEFFDLKVEVNENVLIPRPETEEMLYKIKLDGDLIEGNIMDLGTGSGCIALALKTLYPAAKVSGMDISKQALEKARENSLHNNLDIEWIKADLLANEFSNIKGPYSLIVSNPPYVLNSERELMAGNVLDHEPGAALFVDDFDPLIYYRAIANFCSKYLETEGILWVEINEKFGKETKRLFEESGLQKVTILKDIHGKDRFIKAIKF